MAEHDFSTLRIVNLLDALCTAVDLAREMAGNNQRWLRAINTGWDWLLQQETVSYDHAAHALRVESASEPGKTYISNGACQCSAFEQHNACWHRAAARLVRRALELEPPPSEEGALAAELLADAQADGDCWYTPEIAVVGARSRLPELERVAQEWDAAADLQRHAAELGRRLATARARFAALAA